MNELIQFRVGPLSFEGDLAVMPRELTKQGKIHEAHRKHVHWKGFCSHRRNIERLLNLNLMTPTMT